MEVLQFRNTNLPFSTLFSYLLLLFKEVWKNKHAMGKKKKAGKNGKKLFIFSLMGMEISIFKDVSQGAEIWLFMELC